LAQAPALKAGLAAGACALAVGALAVNRALIGVFYDDGLYAGLALAVARGQGYVHPHLPGTPAAIHYPPLYPLVLAPLFGLLSLPAAALAAKILNLLLAAGAAGLVAWHAVRIRLLGERTPAWLAAAVVAAAAVAIPSLTTQSVLFAEPLFSLLFAMTIVLADRAEENGGISGALCAGGAAALALLTRTIGIAAGAGVAGYLLLVRRAPARRAALAAAPVAVAAAGWGWWTVAHRGGIDPALSINYGSYGEVIRQAGFGAFGASALDLPRPLGAVTLGWLSPLGPVQWLCGALALAVLCYGLWLLVRRSAAGLSLLGYGAILAVWPFPPDRFLWAVLPWIALAWTAAAMDLARRPRLRVGVAALAGVLTTGFLLYEGRGLARRAWTGPAPDISANFREILPALADLPPAAVLATDDEALVWLYSGRSSVPFYLYGYHGRETVEPAAAEQRAYLLRQGVTHILLADPSAGSARQLRRLLATYPGWLTPVRPWPGGRWLYALSRPVVGKGSNNDDR
jgi:hypothetical protein